MLTNITSQKKSIWLKLVIAIAAVFIFYTLAGLMFPVVMAMAVGFVLYPLVRRLSLLKIKGHKIPTAFAIVLSYLVVVLLGAVFVKCLVMPLVTQVNYLLSHMPYLTAQDSVSFHQILSAEWMSDLPPNVRNIAESSFKNMADSFVSISKTVMTSTIDMASGMLSLFIVPFISFYFLKDWTTLRRMVISLFAPQSRPLAFRITKEIGSTLCEYAVGMMKMCLIAAVCITCITSLVVPDYALVLGTMAGFLELVPFIGPLICVGTAAFVAYATHASSVWPIVIAYGIYYVLDGQVILPQIMKKTLAIHPVIIIMGVLIGGKIFGIMGLIFTVPVLCIGKVLYKYLWHLDDEIVL